MLQPNNINSIILISILDDTKTAYRERIYKLMIELKEAEIKNVMTGCRHN